MEIKINLCQLSLDEIMRKIRAYKNDPALSSMILYVKRKEGSKGPRPKQGEPHNVDNLLEERKLYKDNKVDSEDGELKEGKKESQREYGQGLRKGSRFSDYGKENMSQSPDSFDFINDKRLTKARKNYAQGNYDMAISILNELLEQAKADTCKSEDYVEGDKERRVANITFHLGNCYYRKKNYEKAIEYYSLETAQENYKHKAMRRSNLGAIYLQLNRNQESLRNYTQALKIYSQCGCEDMDLSNTYHNVGNIYLRESMYESASKYFHLALEERKLKAPEAELQLFYSAFKLGVSQKFEGRHEDSIKTLFYALSLAERGVGDLVEVYKEIALCYELLGKHNDSLNYYEKICDSGKSREEDRGFAYERASLIYLSSKQYSESCRIMKIAEQCYQRVGNDRKVSELRQMYKKNSMQL